MSEARILYLDDKEDATDSMAEILTSWRYNVSTVNNPLDALRLLERNQYHLIISDIRMPQMSGMEFLQKARRLRPDVRIMLVTAFDQVSQAVEAIKLGACDYVPKSSPHEVLREKIAAALRPQMEQMEQEAKTREKPTSTPQAVLAGFQGMTGQSSAMKDVFELIESVADSNANILITGETGTGKELVAQAIHRLSRRRHKPFLKVDCATLSKELLESELFGHEKGAFTGATDQHIGRLERVKDGTVFLDEIANVELRLQAKLLRVLQDRQFERVGGTKTLRMEARVISATNENIEDKIGEGAFRDDLYHRLNTVMITVPPLRDRKEDVRFLADEFLRRFAGEYQKKLNGFAPEVLEAFDRHYWPGNVRELENAIEQAVILAKGSAIQIGDIPARIRTAAAVAAAPIEVPQKRLTALMQEPEKEIILAELQKRGGNIRETAAALNVSRTTLYTKLKKFGINPDMLRD
jgi:DNA-binding NtrC family response regulator